MPNVKRLLAKKWQWMTLFVLFPLWGIGALQLLVKSVEALSYSQEPVMELVPANPLVSFFVALAFLSTGFASTLRLIWQYQAERIPRLNLIRQVLESELDYDSPPSTGLQASEPVSYTRLWYLSFQNHLFAKSGHDTLKLSPLKQWPAILKNELGQDLVPIWNWPLLLLSLICIPALALVIAASDLIVNVITGVSVCQVSYQIVAVVAFLASTVILTFPIPIAILAVFTFTFLLVPRVLAFMRRLQAAEFARQATTSEMYLSGEDSDTAMAPDAPGVS